MDCVLPFGSLADAWGPEGVNRLTPDLGTPCKGHGWKDLQGSGKICKDLGRFAWKDLQGFGKICKDLGTSSKGHG